MTSLYIFALARDRLAGKFPNARGYRGIRRGLALHGPDDAIATFYNWPPPHAPGAVFRSGEAAERAAGGCGGENGWTGVGGSESNSD